MRAEGLRIWDVESGLKGLSMWDLRKPKLVAWGYSTFG